MFNASSIWNHAYVGAPDGRTAVLDFVGMGTSCYVLFSYPHKFTSLVSDNPTGFIPPRMQLLLLDLLIITLSVVVTTIAYEATYARAVTNAAIRATLDLTPLNAHAYTDPLTPPVLEEGTDLVLNLRSSLLLRHVRQPPSPPPEDTQVPNGAAVVEGLRMLLQAQRALRERQEARQNPLVVDARDSDAQGEERDRRVPGGMDPPEDGG
jgi:hypothetical protein